MQIELQIDGLAALDQKLQLLPVVVARKVIRHAAREAQKIVLKAAKEFTLALPVSKRRMGKMKALIASAWQLRVPQEQLPGSYAIHVQLKSLPEFTHYRQGSHTPISYSRDRHGNMRRRAGGEVGRSFIPSAIEFGHGPNKERSARPFARPAADASLNAVKAMLSHLLGRGIEEEARKQTSG